MKINVLVRMADVLCWLLATNGPVNAEDSNGRYTRTCLLLFEDWREFERPAIASMVRRTIRRRDLRLLMRS